MSEDVQTQTTVTKETTGAQTTTLPPEKVMPATEELPQSDELEEKLPSELFSLLGQRDGAAILLRKLPEAFSPEVVSSPSAEQRAWELTGLFYLLHPNRRRLFEALPIFAALYDHLLAAQEATGERVHKGMPLVWISDCYSAMGFTVLAKQYLMLTLCEDAIRDKGHVDPDTTGVYFRLIWEYGLPDAELKKYAKKVYQLWISNPGDCLFPEWILQELDQNWMTEFPSPRETAVYSANTRYIRHLISRLGEPTGRVLERLAAYLLSCMPGCRTTRRQRSGSTDYDIVCSMEGFDVDFRSELGRYFTCECKDWQTPADFTTMAKFCRVLDSTKSHFGILFSKSGISGYGETADAEREQLKVFQDRGMVIVVVDKSDLEYVASGRSFINLLRAKYERVRLDLTHSDISASDIRTRKAILAATGEFDCIGRDAFLKKYGYGRARSYFLDIDGCLYDSKAIWGVAHGYEYPEKGPLKSRNFVGGKTVAKKLKDLGFEVRVQS